MRHSKRLSLSRKDLHGLAELTNTCQSLSSFVSQMTFVTELTTTTALPMAKLHFCHWNFLDAGCTDDYSYRLAWLHCHKYILKLLIRASPFIRTSDLDPLPPASTADPACRPIETLSTCRIQLFLYRLYAVCSISNALENTFSFHFVETVYAMAYFWTV